MAADPSHAAAHDRYAHGDRIAYRNGDNRPRRPANGHGYRHGHADGNRHAYRHGRANGNWHPNGNWHVDGNCDGNCSADDRPDGYRLADGPDRHCLADRLAHRDDSRGDPAD